MKMSDVFSGTVRVTPLEEEAITEITSGEDSGSDFALEDDNYWLISNENQMKYAAHAINTHDQLAEENERLRKRVAELEGDWTNGNTPPNDSVVVAGVEQSFMRFKHYKKGSNQYKKGIIGRWQKFDGYGWHNCDQPEKWKKASMSDA